MDSLLFAAVLFAAACHAGWNAAIKIGSETLSTTALIAIGAGIVGVALLPFVGAPLAASWSWVAASRQNHRIIRVDACNPALARNVRRRLVQAAMSA